MNSKYARPAIDQILQISLNESRIMKSTRAQAVLSQSNARSSRSRLALQRKDTLARRCVRDPFIESSLASTDPELKDIAECIVVGEAELIVALSKIERALVALHEANGDLGTIEKLRAYQDRVDNALNALLQIDNRHLVKPVTAPEKEKRER